MKLNQLGPIGSHERPASWWRVVYPHGQRAAVSCFGGDSRSLGSPWWVGWQVMHFQPMWTEVKPRPVLGILVVECAILNQNRSAAVSPSDVL